MLSRNEGVEGDQEAAENHEPSDSQVTFSTLGSRSGAGLQLGHSVSARRGGCAAGSVGISFDQLIRRRQSMHGSRTTCHCVST